MVNVTRLKHHEGSFAWINIWAIEREVLCRTHEWNVGFNIVEGTWCIAKVLSLEKNDGEIARHGSSAFALFLTVRQTLYVTGTIVLETFKRRMARAL